MRESADQSGSERPTPASTTFSDLTKEIARRNEEAHKEARKLREASGRVARAQMRARDLR
jgi:hypothetical protein